MGGYGRDRTRSVYSNKIPISRKAGEKWGTHGH
jgi:hypothetical protein